MKIVIADDLPASASICFEVESDWIVDARAGRDASALAAALADADALMVRSATKVTASLLLSAPRLRIVARAGTGVDNVDVPAASARGILVVNAPGANSISVAEHAWALMLSLARDVPDADRTMKEGKWDKKRFLGTELRGKTLGIAGLGRIGQEVAQRARAFGMRVVAHDPYISKEIAAGLGVELMSLDDMCIAADYVTLHLPATAETRHLFERRAVRALQAGFEDHQHRARRTDRRSRVAPRDRERDRGRPRDSTSSNAEPPVDWSLAQLPQVIATPHIRGVDGRSTGTRRPRNGGHGPRFPA
jgi:D-3-phosphoglycerate dehydrogenase